MMYKITYTRRSDRDPNKWTKFSEVLALHDLYDCMKWLEKQEDHNLISVVPE